MSYDELRNDRLRDLRTSIVGASDDGIKFLAEMFDAINLADLEAKDRLVISALRALLRFEIAARAGAPWERLDPPAGYL